MYTKILTFLKKYALLSIIPCPLICLSLAGQNQNMADTNICQTALTANNPNASQFETLIIDESQVIIGNDEFAEHVLQWASTRHISVITHSHIRNMRAQTDVNGTPINYSNAITHDSYLITFQRSLTIQDLAELNLIWSALYQYSTKSFSNYLSFAGIIVATDGLPTTIVAVSPEAIAIRLKAGKEKQEGQIKLLIKDLPLEIIPSKVLKNSFSIKLGSVSAPNAAQTRWSQLLVDLRAHPIVDTAFLSIMISPSR